MKSLPAVSLKPGGHTDGSGEWKIDFVRPDRYHVLQVMWEKQWPDGVVDEWISVGGEEYQNVAGWVLFPQPNKENTNRILSIEKFLKILRSAEPTSPGVYRYQKNIYLLLECNNVNASEISFALGMQSPSCRACLWIDLDTCLLAKGEITVAGQGEDGSKINMEFQQAFTDYNEGFVIIAPRDFVTGRSPA